MSLRDDLLREYSKAHVAFLAKKIGPNQEDFDALIAFFWVMNAGWFIGLHG
jgi:hypothetical protein